MPYYVFFWTPDAIEHLAEHDVTQDDFENAVSHPIDTGFSDSTGVPRVAASPTTGVFSSVCTKCLTT